MMDSEDGDTSEERDCLICQLALILKFLNVISYEFVMYSHKRRCRGLKALVINFYASISVFYHLCLTFLSPMTKKKKLTKKPFFNGFSIIYTFNKIPENVFSK